MDTSREAIIQSRLEKSIINGKSICDRCAVFLTRVFDPIQNANTRPDLYSMQLRGRKEAWMGTLFYRMDGEGS